LSHGRELTVKLGEGADSILVRSPSGDVELAIEIGPDGPRLKVRAVDIELVADKRLSMRCEELNVTVGGTATIQAGGVTTITGKDVHIDAPRGELSLRANDDVDVRGERIRLNCDDAPMPTSWEEFEFRRASSKEQT